MDPLPDPASEDFIAFLRGLAELPVLQTVPGTTRDYPLDAEVK